MAWNTNQSTQSCFAVHLVRNDIAIFLALMHFRNWHLFLHSIQPLANPYLAMHTWYFSFVFIWYAVVVFSSIFCSATAVEKYKVILDPIFFTGISYYLCLHQWPTLKYINHGGVRYMYADCKGCADSLSQSPKLIKIWRPSTVGHLERYKSL